MNNFRKTLDNVLQSNITNILDLQQVSVKHGKENVHSLIMIVTDGVTILGTMKPLTVPLTCRKYTQCIQTFGTGILCFCEIVFTVI